MSLVRPFGAWLPASDVAAAVASPPLGQLTTREWFALSQGNPHSFLHVIRTEIDSEAGGPDPALHETSGRRRLEEMMRDRLLVRPAARAYYVYRIEDAGRTATGLIAEVHVAGYADGRIKRHELTRESTEELLVAHLRRVGAHSDPVALTHADDDELAAIIATVCETRAPYADFTAGGMGHSVWVVADAATVDSIQVRLDRLHALYITDGHHRCAAGLRYAEERALSDPEHEGTEDYHYLLAALYPESELRLLEFNRCVAVHDVPRVELIARIGAVVDLQPVDGDPRPQRHGEVGLVAGERRFRFLLPPAGDGDVFGGLDVVRLQNAVLGPALGITQPRTDPRLHYVAGGRRVDPADHGCAACFLMYPTPIGDVMRIADGGRVMPPKSTWFEPKVWGGLFVALLDDD